MEEVSLSGERESWPPPIIITKKPMKLRNIVQIAAKLFKIAVKEGWLDNVLGEKPSVRRRRSKPVSFKGSKARVRKRD